MEKRQRDRLTRLMREAVTLARDAQTYLIYEGAFAIYSRAWDARYRATT